MSARNKTEKALKLKNSCFIHQAVTSDQTGTPAVSSAMGDRRYASAEFMRPGYEHGRSLYMSDAGLYGLQPSSWLAAPIPGSYDKAALSLQLPPAPPPPPPLEDSVLPGGMQMMTVPRVVARGGHARLLEEDYRVSDPLLLNPPSAHLPMREELGTPRFPDMYGISDDVPPDAVEAVTNGNGQGPWKSDTDHLHAEMDQNGYSSARNEEERPGGDPLAERYVVQ